MPETIGRVLCVDDDPNILRSLQWLLQKDFEVVTADGAAAGLELLKRHDFDVIISDQRMPGKAGSEFLCEAARISPRSMRILLTGYSDLQSTLSSVNEGEVFRYLNKPWSVNELSEIVHEAARLSKTPVKPNGARDSRLSMDTDMILVVDDDGRAADKIRARVASPEKVIYANCLAEAAAAFDNHEIGVVLMDTRVGDVDTTRMIRGLKRFDPAVVAVVHSSAPDSTEVIDLINQGQVFRVLPKSVKPGILDTALKEALSKRAQLMARPELLDRHAVQDVPGTEKQSLLKDIEAERLKRK